METSTEDVQFFGRLGGCPIGKKHSCSFAFYGDRQRQSQFGGEHGNEVARKCACLNEFYHIVREDRLARSLKNEDPITVLDALIRQGMLYYGTTEITMARGEGMCFMNIGRYLERAIQSTDILHVKFKDLSTDVEKMTDPSYWKYFLMSISGYELYLKNYRSGFEAKNILDQIIFNINFPRSVHYSVQMVQRYFERLKNERNMDSFEKINFMIGKLRSNVQFSNVEMTLQEGLPVYLDRVHRELFSVGNALNQHYFAYS